MIDVEEYCHRKFAYGPERCLRTPKHYGLHRDARTLKQSTKSWGDNECAPEERQT